MSDVIFQSLGKRDEELVPERLYSQINVKVHQWEAHTLRQSRDLLSNGNIMIILSIRPSLKNAGLRSFTDPIFSKKFEPSVHVHTLNEFKLLNCWSCA